jgi:valyl-tRNA synthetase
LSEFVLGRSTLSVKDFILKELCDVYLESLKPIMYCETANDTLLQQRAVALDTLYVCLDCVFRLLHPFMPFVTEELWQRLPRREGDPPSILIARYPTSTDAWKNPTIEVSISFFSFFLFFFVKNEISFFSFFSFSFIFFLSFSLLFLLIFLSFHPSLYSQG